MSINTGTLVTAAIRPNDSEDKIASAFATEIKGGLHTATSSTDRDLIILERREWGMMCYVTNDNLTYQLTYGYNLGSTTITDNLNWKPFSGSGGSGTSSEWLSSVFSVLLSNPSTPSNGDRYLVGTKMTDIITGSWSTYLPGFISEYNSTLSSWENTYPTNGTSIRVDDEDNSIYKYEGDYPTGTWYKEKDGQVRYINTTSSNGFDYVGSTEPPIDSYLTDIVYLTTFNIGNTGSSASLNINGLGDTLIKKPGVSGLVDVYIGDLIPSIVYTVSYDGTYFQINIPSTGTTIGPAEDGSYVDGLFTDFTTTTPIGTPIDRFNEILKFLVPPSAPSLSDWSGSKSGTLSNGKLSFDSSNPISGYTPADTITSPVAIDGIWAGSGKRLQIAPYNGGSVQGILNPQVPVHAGVPVPAYGTYSFGDAGLGNLKMYINGTELTSVRVDLSNLSLTSSGANTGFTLTAATSSKFPGGDGFDVYLNRIGVWVLKSDEPLLTYGYNYVYITHDNSPSFVRTLDRFEFIVDNNTDSTLISGPTITSYLFTGSKYLSGINYFTGGSLRYDVTIDNLYKNTFYAYSDAITFTDQSGGTTAPILNVSAQLSLADSLGTETKQFKISNADQNGSSLTFSVISSGKRRDDESVGLSVTAKRTVQGTTSGGTSTISNVLLDNVSSSSTNLLEDFISESYRLKNTGGGLNYDTYGSITSNPWDSTQSLIGGTTGWTEGLQVANGVLKYPVKNYSSFGSLTTNLNFGNALTNYTTAAGNRMYIRYFRQVSPTTGNFTMNIAGSGGSFVSLVTPLTGNNIHVEMKAPGSSSQETGWLDCYSDFATAQWSDGNGGRNSTAGAGRAFSTAWGLTIGTKNTANTSGYLLIRITVGSSFTGSIDTITLAFS